MRSLNELSSWIPREQPFKGMGGIEQPIPDPID